MPEDTERDQFSTHISLRVASPRYLRHLKAIWDLLGKKQVHANREALDIGVRFIVEHDADKVDAKLLKQHLDAMDKS